MLMFRLMRKFAWFTLIGALLLAPICLYSRRCYRRSLDAPVFHFASDVTVLALGDSHPEGAINPKWIPHAENIAHSGDNYFYSYFKLSHFLSKNPQIHTVILGVSWHNFPKDYQDSFLFGDAKGKISAFYPVLDEDGRSFLKSWNSAFLVPWGKYSLGLPLRVYDDRVLQKQLIGARLTRDDFEFFGEYRDSQISHVDADSISRKVAKYFYGPTGGPSDTSSDMVHYLTKILALCSSRNIRVILVNTPVHGLYRSQVPGEMVHALDSILMRATSSFPAVSYFDYSNLPLETRCYYDGDHVNQSGAEIVTKRLVADASLGLH